MNPVRRRLAVALGAIVGAVALVYATGRVVAALSGFPDLADFSSAKVYVYDEKAVDGCVEPLSAKEEEALREALAAIRPMWSGVDADSLVPQTGWPGEMFLLTLDNGEIVTVKDAYQHVLVGRVGPAGRTKAWHASDSSLVALHDFYEEVLAGRSSGTSRD